MLNKRIAMLVILSLALTGASSAFTVKGKVVDGEAGKPAVGLTIQVEHHENRPAQKPDDFVRTTKTDAGGAFRIELQPRERDYMFIVLDAAGRVHDGRTHVKEEMDAGTITLKRDGELHGATKDSEGNPLKDVKITVERRLKPYRCTHYVTVTNVLTDTRGAYSVVGLNHGQYRCTTASPDRAPESSKIDVTDDFAYVELELKPGCTVEGTIVGGEGPVAGVTVSVGGAQATTDGEGNFKLTGLKEGRQQVYVRSKTYASPASKRTYVTCKAGKPANCRLDVVRTGTLFLRMQAAEGGVVIPDKVSVRVRTQRKRGSSTGSYASTTTRSYPVTNGTVVVSAMAAGEYGIQITGEGITTAETEVTVPGGGEEHEIVLLNRAYRLKGKVLDEGGKAIPDVQVTSRAKTVKEDEPAGRSTFARTGPDGSFELKAMAVGEYKLSFRHEDWLLTDREIAIPGSAREALVVTLGKGLTISGTVWEADGSAATNLDVQVTGPKNARGDKRVYKSVAVGEGGVFAAAGLSKGEYDLSIRERGSHETEASLSGVPADTDEVMIVLGAKQEISGVVRSPAGEPVAGASITCTKTTSGGVVSPATRGGDNEGLKSGKDGVFSVKVREGGKYQVNASLAPHLPAVAVVDLSPGADPVAGPLALQLQEGHTVSGKVVDKATGTPAGGVVVRLAAGQDAMFGGLGPTSRDGDDEDVKTDAEGAFTLEGVPAGVVVVAVFRTPEAEHPVATKKVRVRKGGRNDTRIELEKLGTLKGTVLGNDGAPVAEGHVMVYNPRNPMGQFSAQTDGQGLFTIEDVPAGDYMVMCFSMTGEGGNSRQRQARVSVKAGERAEVRLGGKPKSRGPKVNGTVTRAGKPVGPGKISLTKLPDSPDRSSVQASMMAMAGMGGEAKELDDQGTFTVDEGLDAGRHLYSIQLGSGESSAPMGVPGMLSGVLEVAEGEGTLEIRIPTGMLTGKVVGADGGPVEGAQVILVFEGASAIEMQMMRKWGTTDEKGAYRIEGLPPAKYKLTVYHEGGAMAQSRVDVGDGTQTMDVKMGEGVDVSGTIAFADGKAAQRAIVVAASGKDEAIVGYGMADAVGAFAMRPKLAAGEYTLLAYLAGYAVEVRRVTIEKGSSFVFELVPSGDVEITVKDARGKAVAGQTVELKDSSGKRVVRLTKDEWGGMVPWQELFCPATDESGEVTIGGLRPGEYSVSVKGSPNSATVTVAELETAEVTVRP